MENHVPFVGAALGVWIVLVVAFAVVVRRALFAFLLGVLFTGAFVGGYCMFYQGPVEMGGIIHTLFGGFYGVLMFHSVRWLRSRRHRSAPGPEPANPALPPASGSAPVCKSDVSGPAPLSLTICLIIAVFTACAQRAGNFGATNPPSSYEVPPWALGVSFL